MFRAITAAVFVSVFAAGGFSQTIDTAYIPFVVNVDATVTASQSTASVQMDVEAEEGWTLVTGKLPGLLGVAVEWPAHLVD